MSHLFFRLATTLTVVTEQKESQHEEFQTALALYQELKRGLKLKGLVQFHGSHSIIHVPAIGNAKRGKLVAKDLKHISKLTFE